MFTPTTSSRKSKTSTIPLNGLFHNGIWKCNCKPRLPAVRFQVKKQGPNTGKWFYTCQESKEQGCGFFLWDEKAKAREKKTVLSNSRTEPDLQAIPPPDFGRKLGSTKKDGENSFEEYMQESGKRKPVADIQQGKTLDEDDEFDWDLSSDEERRMEDVLERASVDVSTPRYEVVETPVSRKSRKTSIFDTPGTKRKRDGDEVAYPTPNTKTATDSTTPGTRQSIFKSSIEDTPTPNRYHNIIDLTNSQTSNLDSQTSTATVTQESDLTEEVMDILQEGNVKMDGLTERRLRSLLGKYGLKMRGAIKGREITREALRGKELRISELEERVRGLEVERELGRGVLRGLRDRGVDEDDG